MHCNGPQFVSTATKSTLYFWIYLTETSTFMRIFFQALFISFTFYSVYLGISLLGKFRFQLFPNLGRHHLDKWAITTNKLISRFSRRLFFHSGTKLVNHWQFYFLICFGYIWPLTKVWPKPTNADTRSLLRSRIFRSATGFAARAPGSPLPWLPLTKPVQFNYC